MAAIRHSYPDIAPAGPTMSRAVQSGNLLFISGCTARGTDAQGKSLVEQLRATLDRIMRIVATEGGSPANVLRTVTYVTNVADYRDHRPEIQALFEEFFKGDYPTNTLVEITALVEPGLDIEIEATAVLN